MRHISLLFILSFFTLAANAQIITNYAGNDTVYWANDGHAATQAQLVEPCGISVDGKGNLFIADNSGQRIRKVNTTGIISTILGDGTAGHTGDNGNTPWSEVRYPYDVAVDNHGNVYVADFGNNRIRKVDATGNITNYAGGGSSYPGDGGLAIQASLTQPTGVAVDSFGNVYFSSSQRIHKIDPAGMMTLVAGTGTGGYSGDGFAATLARLYDPRGIVVDDGGNIYIADFSNSCIRKVDPAGIISTIAGTDTAGYNGDNIQATAAQLNKPSAVTIDRVGNIYIADMFNYSVRKIVPSGIISTVAGTRVMGGAGVGGPATAAQLNRPRGVAVDRSGNLYIGDSQNNHVKKVSGSFLSVLELPKEMELIIYPDPASRTINFKSNTPVDQLTIYDLSGKLIVRYNDIKGTSVSLPDDIANGVYVLQVTAPGKSTVKQIVINN